MPEPTRDGYTVAGWFTVAEGGEHVMVAMVMTSEVTYYAHWTKNPDSVTPAPVTLDHAPVTSNPENSDPETLGYVVIEPSDVVAPYVAPKAATLMGAVYDGNAVVGIVELKLSKVNEKKGTGKGLVVDTTGGKTNLSSLKLTYTPKKGTFKGSFKVYALEGAGAKTKLKTYTVNVSGVVVDGVGYGKATCKKPAVSWAVTVK